MRIYKKLPKRDERSINLNENITSVHLKEANSYQSNAASLPIPMSISSTVANEYDSRIVLAPLPS
jgi:hypothetical protein